MIYAINFDNGMIDYCTAKNDFHLLKSYDEEYDLSLKYVDSVRVIPDEEAKTIMVNNTFYDERNPNGMTEQVCLFDLAVSDEFDIIACNRDTVGMDVI